MKSTPSGSKIRVLLDYGFSITMLITVSTGLGAQDSGKKFRWDEWFRSTSKGLQHHAFVINVELMETKHKDDAMDAILKCLREHDPKDDLLVEGLDKVGFQMVGLRDRDVLVLALVQLSGISMEILDYETNEVRDRKCGEVIAIVENSRRSLTPSSHLIHIPWTKDHFWIVVIPVIACCLVGITVCIVIVGRRQGR